MYVCVFLDRVVMESFIEKMLFECRPERVMEQAIYWVYGWYVFQAEGTEEVLRQICLVCSSNSEEEQNGNWQFISKVRGWNEYMWHLKILLGRKGYLVNELKLFLSPPLNI